VPSIIIGFVPSIFIIIGFVPPPRPPETPFLTLSGSVPPPAENYLTRPLTYGLPEYYIIQVAVFPSRTVGGVGKNNAVFLMAGAAECIFN